MDDRHASGVWAPAAPVSGAPHPAWPRTPSWEVPYEPYGNPTHNVGEHHTAYADTDPLFGALPSAYGTGAPGDQLLAGHTGPYENGAHDTTWSWHDPACGTGPNGQWYGGNWADHAGLDLCGAGTDNRGVFGVHNAVSSVPLVELPVTADQASPDQAPSFDDPASPNAPADRPPMTGRPGGRGRRAPRRGSAFLAVVAPSVAFVGMAGIAAAAVGFGDSGGGETTRAAPEPKVEPSAANNEFDTRLSTLSREADDFAERASRTQQRVDLEQRRLKEQKLRKAEAARKKAEAAHKEALRPKFVLPVAQKGVGELFGAAGSMWANRHTGLDFPVPMNTPVMAVTDGTLETKWNPSYGYIAEVTAPDGTQTWYAHLAGFRLRSGYVKAGTVIAYAGSSGNSSGPHLHLEVRPGGGDPIDPLPWLRGHGLDPT